MGFPYPFPFRFHLPLNTALPARTMRVKPSAEVPGFDGLSGLNEASRLLLRHGGPPSAPRGRGRCNRCGPATMQTRPNQSQTTTRIRHQASSTHHDSHGTWLPQSRPRLKEGADLQHTACHQFTTSSSSEAPILLHPEGSPARIPVASDVLSSLVGMHQLVLHGAKCFLYIVNPQAVVRGSLHGESLLLCQVGTPEQKPP